MEDNDPLFEYTFSQLNSSSSKILDEDYFYYRQSRLNYWAVKALQARVHLYLGNKAEAHTIAMEIINAKNVEGDPVKNLSGVSDLNNGYMACPTECLFYISKYDILDYATKLLGGNGEQVRSAEQLVLTYNRFTELYAGVNTASHNRYQLQWNRNVRDAFSNSFVSTKKYYFNEDDVSSSQTRNLLIPMIRMSEIYLMAIETATSLDVANKLYDTYMRDHNILLDGDAFSSLDDIQGVVIDEYRREFFAEGVMFYVYKRTNSKNMMWRTTQVTENAYLLPLPDTEFNPNDIQK